jgi:hypothetical protein
MTSVADVRIGKHILLQVQASSAEEARAIRRGCQQEATLEPGHGILRDRSVPADEVVHWWTTDKRAAHSGHPPGHRLVVPPADYCPLCIFHPAFPHSRIPAFPHYAGQVRGTGTRDRYAGQVRGTGTRDRPPTYQLTPSIVFH